MGIRRWNPATWSLPARRVERIGIGGGLKRAADCDGFPCCCFIQSVSQGIGVPRGAALRPDLVERPLPMIKSKILYTFTLELYNHWILKTLLGAPPSLSHPDRDRVVLLQRLCCAWAGENIPCCSLPAEEDVQQVVPRGRPAAAASWLTARVAVSVPLPLPLPVCSLSIITVHMKESPIASTSRQTLRKSCSFLHGCV